jgi:hypothetical protein
LRRRLRDIRISVTDTQSTPQPVTPLTFFWTWTDKRGIVINDREAEEISGADLGETVTVKLFGDDLEVPSGSQAIRLLTVQGTYMDKDGEIMPFSDGIYVQIDNLAGIQTIV